MIKLSPEEQLILASVPIYPKAKDIQTLEKLIPEIKSWDKLGTQLIDRGLAPLFYAKLPHLSNSYLIPRELIAKLKQAYFITLSRNMVLYDAFTKMAKILNAQHIPFIALKGIYLSEILYKDIGLRQLSDIDILVEPENAEKCLQALYNLGYRSNNNKQFEFIRKEVGFIHYDPMVLNGVSIEVHIRLLHKSLPYKISTEQCFNRAQQVMIHNEPALTLEPIDHLIFICLHFYKHFTSGHIQFTSIMDIANLLCLKLQEIDYTELIYRCREYNCEADVFRTFLLVDKYCNSSIPTHFILDHQHLLTKEHEELFIRYLNGYDGKHFTVEKNINKLKNINGLTNKLRYFFYMAFPTKGYMVRSYKIKRTNLFWLYYPYRYWIGIKGLWRMLRKKN